MPCERNLCPSGLGRVGAQLNFELFGAMGEKLDRPPGIDWSRYSTTALVEAIQQVAEEIKAREGEASVGSASAAVVWRARACSSLGRVATGASGAPALAPGLKATPGTAATSTGIADEATLEGKIWGQRQIERFGLPR